MIDRVVIDLDGVVFDTIDRICALYNEDFEYYTGFTRVESTNINTWEFTELYCATPEYINQYFNQPRFFTGLKIMPCAKWIINKLADKYEIHFVSTGNMPNLRLKQIWKDQHFPYARLTGVNLDNHKDKSHIDMSNSIQLDDRSDNLKTSNAAVKICYGKVYPWNEDWQGIRCETWSEVYGKIRKVVEEGYAD